MVYLFWAFAAVWVGIFVYVYGLARRARILEAWVEKLRAEAMAGRVEGRPAGSGSGRGHG